MLPPARGSNDITQDIHSKDVITPIRAKTVRQWENMDEVRQKIIH